ncbi:MAG: lysoplasmalogenase family protein, partial [Ferruginibacter sp.]
MKYVFLRYGKILFLFLAITDLLFIAFQKDFLRLFTKPLLMLVLAVYVMYLPAAKNKNTWLIISGLLFAAAGDTLLMFENSNANMFIFGLASFLITHLLY